MANRARTAKVEAKRPLGAVPGIGATLDGMIKPPGRKTVPIQLALFEATRPTARPARLPTTTAATFRRMDKLKRQALDPSPSLKSGPCAPIERWDDRRHRNPGAPPVGVPFRDPNLAYPDDEPPVD